MDRLSSKVGFSRFPFGLSSARSTSCAWSGTVVVPLLVDELRSIVGANRGDRLVDGVKV